MVSKNSNLIALDLVIKKKKKSLSPFNSIKFNNSPNPIRPPPLNVYNGKLYINLRSRSFDTDDVPWGALRLRDNGDR